MGKLKYDKVNKNPPILHTQILMFPFCPKSGSPAPIISMNDSDGSHLFCPGLVKGTLNGFSALPS